MANPTVPVVHTPPPGLNNEEHFEFCEGEGASFITVKYGGKILLILWCGGLLITRD